MVGSPEAYAAFKIKLEHLPENVIVIASHTQTDNRKEKVCKGTVVFLSLLESNSDSQNWQHFLYMLSSRILVDYCLQSSEVTRQHCLTLPSQYVNLFLFHLFFFPLQGGVWLIVIKHMLYLHIKGSCQVMSGNFSPFSVFCILLSCWMVAESCVVSGEALKWYLRTLRCIALFNLGCLCFIVFLCSTLWIKIMYTSVFDLHYKNLFFYHDL